MVSNQRNSLYSGNLYILFSPGDDAKIKRQNYVPGHKTVINLKI